MVDGSKQAQVVTLFAAHPVLAKSTVIEEVGSEQTDSKAYDIIRTMNRGLDKLGFSDVPASTAFVHLYEGTTGYTITPNVCHENELGEEDDEGPRNMLDEKVDEEANDEFNDKS